MDYSIGSEMPATPQRPAQGLCHVSPRGQDGNVAFLDDVDKSMFLGLLECTVYRFRWILSAYCLMDTHYHPFVDTSRENLASAYVLCTRHAPGDST